ncbi:O-antigen ligase family protein [bacterium]|nr:O-antigen ligase family protein [bacterium]
MLRLNIWEGALAILIDHPLTGVGMDRFRAPAVRRAYPVEGFNMPIGASDYDPTFPQPSLPHAHNELLQAGVDLGLPGMIVFIAWYASALWMLWVCWRDGDAAARVAAAAIFAGLLAHGAYGLSDAITLWDRFSFLFWVMLGLASAQYVAVRSTVLAA